MWYMHEGAGWWLAFGGVWMVLFWGGLIALIVWGIKKLTDRGGSNSISNPLGIARERYAGGKYPEKSLSK